MGSWYERGLPFLASCLRGVPFSPYARARAHARAVRCSSCCSCIDVRAGGWGALCGRAGKGCARSAGRRAAWSAGRQAAWGGAQAGELYGVQAGGLHGVQAGGRPSGLWGSAP